MQFILETCLKNLNSWVTGRFRNHAALSITCITDTCGESYPANDIYLYNVITGEGPYTSHVCQLYLTD